MEAVRDSTDPAGAVVLARLDAQFVKWQPHARVESTPVGFVAFVGYQPAPYTGMICTATAPLRWTAKENAAPASPFGMPVAASAGLAAEARP
jgi:hypothetical protein